MFCGLAIFRSCGRKCLTVLWSYMFCGLFAVMVVLPCHTGNAQIYKFQQYDPSKGLCNKFVNAIVQDKHGFIWFATGLGLCRYDGFRFTSPDDNVPSGNVTTAFKDDRGNLWFGYDDGTTVKYDGSDFSIADTSKTAVTQIVQIPKGEVFVATQREGITRIGRKIDRLTEGFEEMMIYALCFIDHDRLLVGSQNGLYLYDYNSERFNVSLIASNENLSNITVTAITPKVDGTGYWVATEEDGIFLTTIDNDRFSTLRLNIPEIEYTRVQSIDEDTQNNLWVSTFGAGLLRVQLSKDMHVVKVNVYNSANGLGSDNVKQVFYDNQQDLWVATFGQGVACITNPTFSFFEAIERIGNNATAVFSTDDSEYWVAGVGTIIRITPKNMPSTTIFGRSEHVPNDKITVLRVDDKENLWIGTENSGLYKLPKGAKIVSQVFNDENSLSNTIKNFVLEDDEIWMATYNGVLVVNAKTGKITNHYTTSNGKLPHNRIRDIFKDSQNRIWVATTSNSIIDVKNGDRRILPDRAETEFSVIAEDDQKRIWAGTAGTNGKGVYLFDKDTVYQFTVENGLMTDYCYAMTCDGNGHLWIGHRQGLTSINTKRLTVNTFGVENGINGDVNSLAMMINKSNEILIGMTDGLLLYDVKINQHQEMVPILNLAQVLINDHSYPADRPVVLPYNKNKYKIQFDFVGLQYSNPNSVSYQYQLLGYDSEWSSISKTTTAIYRNLQQGNYYFWVKACNSDTCTDETMLYIIKIRNPYYLTWWFLLLVITVVIGLGYIVITIRERNHRIQQEYLENELKARTREVRKQKEEIEVKNRDITDSINYAQRIQFSVLPSKSTLLEHCSDAFIFYRPRDIVSGDFYWFDYFPQNHRLLIVCADSTGHGVPGAFMSLIGTTLIKDITLHPEVRDPADILYRLDENVQSTLNQNRDSEQANDGMDIIVCDINTETYFAKIASAMRPYIIYQKGIPKIYKSSRSSIGGQRIENKIFETVEVQLSKGDTIYMFTDGYTDQFGGPSGKKFKMNRLQNILDDIHTRNMDEQFRFIKENFDLWKGSSNQIDDVLMIGVRI